MRTITGLMICAAIGLSACDEQIASLNPAQGDLVKACTALFSARTGVPNDTVLIMPSGSGGNLTAQAAGVSTPWICEVRGGNQIVGVYPAGQARPATATRSNAPVYQVAPTTQPVVTQPRTYILDQPQAAQTHSGPTAQPVFRSTASQTLSSNSCNPLVQACRLVPATSPVATPAQPEPTYIQPLYSGVVNSPRQVGNTIVYSTPSGINNF